MYMDLLSDEYVEEHYKAIYYVIPSLIRRYMLKMSPSTNVADHSIFP